MVDTMFVFEHPFVRSVSKSETVDYLSDSDRAYEADLRRICLQFAVKHNLVLPKEDPPVQFTQATNVDVNGWIYAVNWMNFRSLVNPSQLQSLINRLLTQSTNEMGDPLELVIDLHTRIGCLFDHLFLDMIVNRVMTSISSIPYQVEKGTVTKSWEDIHIELPWLWCLIYVQNLIRTETVR